MYMYSTCKAESCYCACMLYMYHSALKQNVFFHTANPAVLPVQEDQLITAMVGDSVSIEFKISSLPMTEPHNIKWFHQNSPISTTENFSQDRRSLVIDRVQPSDAGHYQVEVCVNSQCKEQHTNLSIIGKTVCIQYVVHVK